jgi:hypothetical protein
MKTGLSKQSFLFTVILLTLLWIALPSIGGEATVQAGDSNIPPQDALLLADAGFAAGELKPLIGRWLRPDGGYILEIREAAPDGKLEAYYFNPRSINVHRAEATRVKSDLKIVVELRDAGYPGSTYALLYKPDQDVLVGYYFQAGRKQYFEVHFVRQK